MAPIALIILCAKFRPPMAAAAVVAAGEDYSDLADEKVNCGGAEFARLIGRKAWQGYGRAGPKLEDMALVRAAYQTQYG